MNKKSNFISRKLFDDSVDFKARLFNLLAVSGIVACAIITLKYVLLGLPNNALFGLASILIAILAIVYLRITKKYEMCFLMSTIGIFCMLFPTMFFTSGGFHSGMPILFVFASIFSVLILNSKTAVIMVLFENLIYIFCCTIGFLYPHSITPLPSDFIVVIDIITSLLVVTLVCGMVIYLYVREYDIKSRELSIQNERLRKYDEAKSSFLQAVAHEVKNPLAAIVAQARDSFEMCDEEPLELDYMKKNLDSVGKTAMRIDTILNDLMDTVSIEQGRLSLFVSPAYLEEIAREAHRTYEKEIAQHKNTLVLDVKSDLEPIDLDSKRVMQVILNLLSNANRYTKNGTITIRVEEDLKTQSVSVVDTGSGMSEKIRNDVLKGYVSTEQEDYWRHGIGLYICHQIVTAHKGKIEIYSKENEGTNVKVIFYKQ